MSSRLKQTRLLMMAVRIAVILPLTAARGVAADAAGGASPGYGPDIADALGDQAVKVNPSVGAVEHRVTALKQSVRAAGAWMDPMFSVEYSNMPIDNPVPGNHPMSGIQFMLRQTFFWPGKISAREDEAKAKVRENELALEEQKVQLRAQVRRAYYRLALTRQLRVVTKTHVQLVSDFIDIVRVKNQAGIAAQHELLRLRVLVSQLNDDLNNFDQDEQSLTATINATLHRPIDTPIATPKEIAVEAPSVDAQTLIRRAERERPSLQRYQAQAETYRAAARRAAREGYPDITVWAGYRIRVPAMTDPGTDFVSVGVSLPLPLWYDRRSGSERRMNEQLAESALESRAAELDSIRGELGRVVAAWKRAAQEARTYRAELTPAAKLALDATFASYQADRADFASLFQAELQLLNFERTTRAAEASAAAARVDVEALVGRGVK